MPVSLLKQAYQTRRKLTAFGLDKFASEFDQVRQELASDHAITEDEHLALVDWFVLEAELPDHRTVLSHFLEEAENEVDVQLAEQWNLVIHGIFHVRSLISDQHYELMNLVNDVTYRVASPPDTQLGLEKGEYLAARLISFQDHHVFTGVIDRLPTRKKNEIYEMVAELTQQHPAMAFVDNPERIELAYRIQNEEHQDFVTFFGDDEIVLSGAEIEERMKEFYHYRYFQKKQLESGSTIAKIFQDRYHQPPLPPHFEFLDDLQKEPDIGVIYDRTEGLVFLLRYGRFLEIFQREDFKRIPRFKQMVCAYLEDPHVSSLPFKRMAERYPEQAVEVFKAVLKRKRFNLASDLPTLIRRYKPMEQLRRLTPSTIPSPVRSKTFLRNLKQRSKW